MKHKWYQIFLSAIIALGMITIGSSAFVMTGADEMNYGELSNKDSDEDLYVTLDYNDQETLDYRYFISKGDTLDLTGLDPDTTGTNHTFDGWYYTKSGYNADGTSSAYSSSDTFSGGETLYAKYYSTGSYYAEQTANVDIAPSGSSQAKVYLSPSGSIANAMTLSSTVQVYYDSSKTQYSTSTTGSDYSVKWPNEAGALVVLDCDLIIEDGALFQLNCITCLTSGTAMGNAIAGSYTALDLNGYNIYIRSGGTLNGYGIIYNSKDTGGIIVQGGTVLSIITPIDFGGGGQTVVRYYNSAMVFSGLIMPYLCCECVFSCESTLSADCSLYANSSKNSTTANVIAPASTSSSSVLKVTNGYIIRRTTPYLDLMRSAQLKSESSFIALLDSAYRETLIFCDKADDYVESITGISFYDYGRATAYLDDFELSLYGVTVSFSYTEFPIASFFSLYFYNCDFEVSMPVVFMPGSYAYTDSSTVITLSTQSGYSSGYTVYGRISVLDAYPNAEVRVSSSDVASTRTNLNQYYLTGFGQARIDMNGTFAFDTSATVSASSPYYQFYSIGGYINCSQKAIDSITSNSSYLKLNNYWAFLGCYSASDTYYACVQRYYNQPLISNGKAYFQTASLGTVYEGNLVDGVDYVYEYEGDYYFYVYTNASSAIAFTSLTKSGALFNNTPDSSRVTSHYANFAGDFQKASSFSYLGDINDSKRTYYTYYSSQYYIPLAGLMFGVSEQPTSGNMVNDCTVFSSTNQFTFSTTTYSIGDTLEYYYAGERWRFAV